MAFFRLFREKVKELSRSTTCLCHACTPIENLRLKVVAHSGKALFHRVLNFMELAGVDVIIVHRLLKNSVASDQYLLLSEAAGQDLAFPGEIQWRNSSETRLAQLARLLETGSVARSACSGEFLAALARSVLGPTSPTHTSHGDSLLILSGFKRS